MAASGVGKGPVFRGVAWKSESRDDGTAPDILSRRSYQLPFPPHRWQK